MHQYYIDTRRKTTLEGLATAKFVQLSHVANVDISSSCGWTAMTLKNLIT